MTAQHRVYITGMGMLTAAGCSVDDNWHALLHGQSHLGPIESAQLHQWSMKIGGEIRGLNPAKLLPDRKLIKAISYQDSLGIIAAAQAIEDSQLIPYRDELANPTAFNESTGVYVGSPGNKYLQQYDFLPLMAKTKGNMQDFAAELFNEVHPMWLLRILPNNVLAYTGMTYQFKGPNHNVTNHAVGGFQALIEAYHAIAHGQIDRAVVVAYDLGLDPQALFYYDKLGLLSHEELKPFDAHHSGTVLANGAAALVLESEASIQERQGHAYAELCGGRSLTEGEGLFNLDQQAQQLTRLISDVLNQNHCQAEDLAFVTAHGNGSKASDDSELRALHHHFADSQTPIAAFKWCMGHTLVASGLVDTLLSIQALRQRFCPGIANLHNAHPQAKNLNLNAQGHDLGHGEHALILNRGFASMNAAIMISTQGLPHAPH